MVQVNETTVGTELASIIDRVLSGEDVVILRDGVGVARLVPVVRSRSREEKEADAVLAGADDREFNHFLG